jgi:flagellar basal body-associated protein FliL
MASSYKPAVSDQGETCDQRIARKQKKFKKGTIGLIVFAVVAVILIVVIIIILIVSLSTKNAKFAITKNPPPTQKNSKPIQWDDDRRKTPIQFEPV